MLPKRSAAVSDIFTLTALFDHMHNKITFIAGSAHLSNFVTTVPFFADFCSAFGPLFGWEIIGKKGRKKEDFGAIRGTKERILYHS